MKGAKPAQKQRIESKLHAQKPTKSRPKVQGNTGTGAAGEPAKTKSTGTEVSRTQKGLAKPKILKKNRNCNKHTKQQQNTEKMGE